MYKSWRLTIDLKNVGRCRSVLGVGRVAGSKTIAQQATTPTPWCKALKGTSLGEVPSPTRATSFGAGPLPHQPWLHKGVEKSKLGGGAPPSLR